MRFRELSLLAYGPFAGVALDLSAPGLHVVYGRNEAGKSTALRAVRGLLFGIDARTGDAHLHAMKDLRIGAALEDEEGRVLRVVRRKGTANTLLDPAGKAIDEAPLRRMLGGATQDLFEKMFGLDYLSLRDGGEALALGQGDVGESLFGASLGSEVHEVLRSLRDEADRIFAAAPNATRPPLNAALRAFADAQKRVRALSDSQAILVQQQGLDAAVAERAACEKEKRELSAQAARVRRARDVVPLLAKRALLDTRRRELGDVPILPESARRDREEAERDRVEAELKAERLDREISTLAATREALLVPRAIEREDLADDLQHRLGAHRQSKDELSRVRAELAELEDEARSLASRTRRDVGAARDGDVRVDAGALSRVKKLALQHAALDQRWRTAEEQLASKSIELEARRAALATMGRAADPSPLRRVLSRAQLHGDVDQRARAAAAEVAEKEDGARVLLAALGLFTGPLDEARGLAVPSAPTVERFAQRAEQAERSASKLVEQRDEAARRAAQAARDVDALTRAEGVPTEEGLAGARARREEAWASLRERWSDALAARYEALVTESDAIADRLRREADRVVRLAALEAERAACEVEQARVARAAEALDAERARADVEWRAVWEASRIVPLPPVEMRVWLERLAKLRVAADALRAAELQLDRLEADSRDLRAALLDALGEERHGHDEDAATLVARVTEEERARSAAAQARAEAERATAALEKEAAAAARERDESAAALDRWRAAWAPEVEAAGLSPDAAPEEATTLADDLAALARAAEDARRKRRRLAAMDAEASAFAADVQVLAGEHAPELEGQSPEDAAAALVRGHALAREARAEQRRLDASLADKRAALAELRERRALAEARLEAMKRAARAEDTAALEGAERASSEARGLDAQLLAIEERLAEIGHGPGDDHELTALGGDALEARAEELGARIEELDQRHRALERTIGGLEKGLSDIRRDSAAAQAASEAQEHLARIRACAERYARVRVAEVVLAREIERYRERHQGPVLARAGALFSRMTLGSFGGLRVGYGEADQPVLFCVRAEPAAKDGDRDVAVAALSDGTRDQLYLALRLATLERYAETRAPLPLVVDDILVHFDDDRARAALEVLGEVAARMQVILFTHHARVVELAQASVRAVRVHALSPAALPAATPAP